MQDKTMPNYIYINSLSLSVCLWHDVLLQKHFLCFCCRTGHKEKHRRLEPILKICLFATTQMHVNFVSSPERMIAAWQAMHKVIWSTTSYILWINCCISLWTQFVCVSRERESELAQDLSHRGLHSSRLQRIVFYNNRFWKFVSLQQHKCMSILFPLQKEWLLLDKPCTRLYDPLPVTFSIATRIAEETKRKFLLLWQRCGGRVRFLRDGRRSIISDIV